MKTWRILRLDHDDQEGHSIWGIQNFKTNEEFYIGMSESYSPPNNSWETIEEVGKNPAPGLQFITIDTNVMKKLVPDEPKVRQNIFVPTKRKRKGIGGNNNYNHEHDDNMTHEDYHFDDNDANDVIVSLDSFKLAIMTQKHTQENSGMSKTPDSMILNGSPYDIMESKENNDLNINVPPNTVRKVSFNPTNLAKHNAMMNGQQHKFDGRPRKNSAPMRFSRTDSIASTASVYAIPDEVQSALAQYQSKVMDLEKELKEERKRALTLSHQHKTQTMQMQEHEEKLTMTKQEYNKKIEFFRDELDTVNQAYYQLWIKQCLYVYIISVFFFLPHV